jgi:hypothetical protein
MISERFRPREEAVLKDYSSVLRSDLCSEGRSRFELHDSFRSVRYVPTRTIPSVLSFDSHFAVVQTIRIVLLRTYRWTVKA